MGQSFVYARAPQRVYWETTRACDLACRHCRAEAAPDPDPAELTTAEGRRLLERVAAFGEPLPHVVLTGGDPLKRKDLFELVAAARTLGLRVSVAPSATPLLTPEALRQLHTAGIDAISLSLDGSTAEGHDAIRGIPGTYERTLEAARIARETGLPFQVNTLVCAETVDDLPAIHDLVVAMGAARWSLFFLVTVGRGQVLQPVSAERAEALLGWVAGLSAPPGRGRLVVTTTEAPQLRRVVIERRRHADGTVPESSRLPGAPLIPPQASATATASSSSRTPVRSARRAFWRSPPATCGVTTSSRSTARQRSSGNCAIRACSAAGAAGASIAGSAAAPVPARSRHLVILSPRIPCACTTPPLRTAPAPTMPDPSRTILTRRSV